MNEYFGLRNFRQFERSRREIRLPYDLLNDGRFRQLADAHKAHLLCLFLLAARMDNVLPNRPAKLAALMGATEPLDLLPLAGLIDFFSVEGGGTGAQTERRSLTDRVRAAVLVRDGGRCRKCRSARNLEVDHIIPLSKGGSSDEFNLQTLCRRCNRRKWKKLVARI